MSRQLFFCSELSRRVAEKPHGTASIGDVWLLVEYAQAWGSNALADSDLSPELKKYLSRLVKSIPRARLLFIKQERPPLERRNIKDRINVFVVRTRERAPFIVKFELESYEQLMNIDVAAVVVEGGASGGGGVVTQEPLFLVCTHGRRDKCCAKFGYALYKSLRGHVGDSVWQSSHVGGDRFAANLICFPHGLFYAHVTEEVGRTIVAEYAQGRLALGGYRGRVCYGYAVQAAEFFIRRESGITGLDELRFLRRARVDENHWRVQFVVPATGRIYEAQVVSRLSEFENHVTCHSTGEQRVIQYLLDTDGVASINNSSGSKSHAPAGETPQGIS